MGLVSAISVRKHTRRIGSCTEGFHQPQWKLWKTPKHDSVPPARAHPCRATLFPERLPDARISRRPIAI